MRIRCDVRNIANELAIGQGIEIDLSKVAMCIQNYCIENGVKPRNNEYKLTDGLLYINQKAIERVLPAPRKMAVSEWACYQEGRILGNCGWC